MPKKISVHESPHMPGPLPVLSGPASSQVRIGIDTLRVGLPGAVCARLGFTIPSALAMILFGFGNLAIRRGCLGARSSQWQLLRRLFEE